MTEGRYVSPYDYAHIKGEDLIALGYEACA